MLSKRKKRPVQHTRLRFGRRGARRETHSAVGRDARERFGFDPPTPLPPFGWQTLATMDLSEYDEDLIELKRRCEARGMNIQIPKRGATITLPDPIDFGESLSDIVIRNRGREPER
jgi:hypothetical protein